jgi:hypothetical protein
MTFDRPPSAGSIVSRLDLDPDTGEPVITVEIGGEVVSRVPLTERPEPGEPESN